MPDEQPSEQHDQPPRPRLVPKEEVPDRIKPWMATKFVVTPEQMLLQWLDVVRNNGHGGFCFAGDRWYEYRDGIWRTEDADATTDNAIGAFQREVADDISNKNVPRKQIEANELHNAIKRRASCELRMTVENFDANDALIAFPHGWIDIDDYDADVLELKPHRKENYFSRCCSSDPKDMETPLWDDFVQTVQPDPEVRAFLYRFFGYCLTGRTNLQSFVFFYGTGQNGKGTFIDTVRLIMGTYAAQASINLLTRQRYERHPEELAQLRGLRLVVADETDKGTYWDEAKLKHIVSGERLRARFMRGNSFEYTPRFKISISGNNKPQITSTDKAMRRRIMLVPWKVQIPDEKRNLKLKEDLKEEYEGILYKLLQGLREYQRIGLCPPAVITAATTEYVEEEDAVKQWLDEENVVCYVDPIAKTNVDEDRRASIQELFTSWSKWCVRSGEDRGSKKAMTRALKDRGYIYYHGGGFRGFRGMYIPQIKPEDFDDR